MDMLIGPIDTSFSLSDRSTGNAAYFCHDCGDVLAVPTADDRCKGGCDG